MSLAHIRPLLFDASVLIPMFRGVAYEDLFQRALRSGRARVSSVVMQELYAGALAQADKRDYDVITRAFSRRGYMLTPDHNDWTESGIILARYQQRYGALEPCDHINDILIVLSAAKAHAELITENDAHMTRWREMLRRSGKTLTITAVRRPQ